MLKIHLYLLVAVHNEGEPIKLNVILPFFFYFSLRESVKGPKCEHLKLAKNLELCH